MPSDKLTPLKRLELYGKGQPVDRLPCVPIIGNTAARVVKRKVSETRGSGELLAKAQIASYRLFGYDVVRVFTDLYVMAEAMGAKVRVPEDETAYLEAPALASLSETGKLRPPDLKKDGVIPAHLEAMRRCADEIGSEVSISGALTGPFTNASFLVGAETLVRLTMKEPDAVHKLCEISLEAALELADAIIDAGCAPSLTDAMSSSTVISPKQFKEFSQPYLKTIVSHIHSRGKKATLHICGKTRPIWEAMADTGADCLSLDNAADLEEAKSKVGSRVRLMGNVPPSEVLLQGSPEDVRSAVRSCVAKAADNPKGLVVASGCSLATETPFENIHAMLDAVREIGWPVEKESLR